MKRVYAMQSIQFSTILFIGICYSQTAAAYLDPGTGSLILQMLIAGIVGAIFTIKLYWYQFKAFVARIFGKQKEIESDLDNDDSSEEE